MTEWRRCAHCRRRYLWRKSWPSELCPRCHKRLERAQNAEKPAGHTTEHLKPQETRETRPRRPRTGSIGCRGAIPLVFEE
jgi:hypothetical protein